MLRYFCDCCEKEFKEEQVQLFLIAIPCNCHNAPHEDRYIKKHFCKTCRETIYLQSPRESALNLASLRQDAEVKP